MSEFKLKKDLPPYKAGSILYVNPWRDEWMLKSGYGELIGEQKALEQAPENKAEKPKRGRKAYGLHG